MPRPKVKAEDRQRSVRACVPCKASKIRCDAGVPCGPCSKRDRISSCIYLEPSQKRRRLNSMSTADNGDASPSFRPSSAHATPTQEVAGVPPVKQTRKGSEVVSKLTESRMLLTSKGEKVYVGESASLSFLQFLRHILRNYMGPSGFTEHRLKDSMLEVETTHDESPMHNIETRKEKLALVQLYREASSGILDLYTLEEVDHFLDHHDSPDPSDPPSSSGGGRPAPRADQAALDMMLAIGRQCRGRQPADDHNAARSLARARTFAFAGFLCDPSIDMVRVLTMMAFYMAQACHRNAAYMYTGIASKAACALGLHRRGEYKGLSRGETLVRWRTWKSLVIMDTIISAILGRPGSIVALHPDDATRFNSRPPPPFSDPSSLPPDSTPAADHTRYLSSRAVFAICSHVLELQQRLGGDANVDVATAETFLGRLREWDRELPAELRHFGARAGGGAPLGPTERELFMGATHASCMYYFTTILVTRPFLIAQLMGAIAGRGRDDGAAVGRGRGEGGVVPELAQACLDAALYLARTGYMAVTSELLSNNMCLLKAWTFAAGLVLGFSMFADSTEPVREIDEAFAQATFVLERLAEASPQARHYYEILTGLDEAVRHRREQLARERRRKAGRYVSQIFTADFPGSDLTSSTTDASGAAGTGDLGHVGGGEAGVANGTGDGHADRGGPSMGNAPGSFNDPDPLANFEFPDWAGQIDAWADIPLLSDNLYFDWGNGDETIRF